MSSILLGGINSITADVHSDTGGYSPSPHTGDPSSKKESAQEEKKSPPLKVVETAPVDPDAFFKDTPPLVAPPAPPPPAKPDPNAPGRTNALVQTFQALQSTKEAVIQRLGWRSYTGTRSKGKRTTLRKGIIVDKQID